MAAPTFDEAAIFNAARHIEDPAARRRYVREACGDDDALAERVEALLRAHDEDTTFLAAPAEDVRAWLGAAAEQPTLAPREATDAPARPIRCAGLQISDVVAENDAGSLRRPRPNSWRALVVAEVYCAIIARGPVGSGRRPDGSE